MGGCVGAIFNAIFPKGRGCGSGGCATFLAILLALSFLVTWVEAIADGNLLVIGITATALVLVYIWLHSAQRGHTPAADEAESSSASENPHDSTGSA